MASFTVSAKHRKHTLCCEQSLGVCTYHTMLREFQKNIKEFLFLLKVPTGLCSEAGVRIKRICWLQAAKVRLTSTIQLNSLGLLHKPCKNSLAYMFVKVSYVAWLVVYLDLTRKLCALSENVLFTCDMYKHVWIVNFEQYAIFIIEWHGVAFLIHRHDYGWYWIARLLLGIHWHLCIKDTLDMQSKLRVWKGNHTSVTVFL